MTAAQSASARASVSPSEFCGYASDHVASDSRPAHDQRLPAGHRRVATGHVRRRTAHTRTAGDDQRRPDDERPHRDAVFGWSSVAATAGPGVPVLATASRNDHEPDTTCPSADVTR